MAACFGIAGSTRAATKTRPHAEQRKSGGGIFRNGYSSSHRAFATLKSTASGTGELQITQPDPIAMPGTEFHEPQTRHIQDGDGHNPHGVNERQTMTIARRFLGEVRNDGSVPDGLVKRVRGNI